MTGKYKSHSAIEARAAADAASSGFSSVASVASKTGSSAVSRVDWNPMWCDDYLHRTDIQELTHLFSLYYQNT